MKLNWQRTKWGIDYGYDDSFGTGTIKNNVSFCVTLKGYYIGLSISRDLYW
jgi:hypothetical protein